MSSRCSNVNRGLTFADITLGGITPPASLNHCSPAQRDTPTAAEASLAERPDLTCPQNRRRTPEWNPGRPNMATPSKTQVLHRPLELKGFMLRRRACPVGRR